MNGAVYISFFQGQLESVLEQVVQLAVQEISKTVGASLNSMLIETAVKEQENQRLRLKLQSREFERIGIENGSVSNGGKTDNAATDRTKPGSHTPSLSTERSVFADTRRLEQKGRVVGQLKAVMEQVLDFAMSELSKIVEASFEDLLLEITVKEREQRDLEERLRSAGRPENGKSRAARRRGSEHDSASPSGSEGARDEAGDAPGAKIGRKEEANETANGSEKPDVLSVAQDWVPILDKVFGQKWCSDLWQIKELVSTGNEEEEAGQGSGSTGLLSEEDLKPSPSSPLQEPQWMPLEDMTVLSTTPDPQPSPGPAPTPTAEDSPLRSPSMLHRLLTLPAQLLEDDEDTDAMETLPAPAEASPAGAARSETESPSQSCLSPPKRRDEDEDEEEEGEDEDDKGTKGRSAKCRKSLECKECGKRFSRAPLLKAHQQTHSISAEAAAVTSVLHCADCGKRFSLASRLQAHLRTHAGKKT